MEILRHLGATIRALRRGKGWTQRDLGQRIGLPQSHVSRIESGAVDLQLSSLTEIARALDFEVKLVPRRVIPAVEAVLKAHHAREEDPIPRPAYRLEEDDA